MSHFVLMGSLSCNEMIFHQLSGIIILIFSLVPVSGGRLSDVLVSMVRIHRHYCSSDVVWLSVIRNGTCAYSFRGCDLWSYSLLSLEKRMNSFIYFRTLAAVVRVWLLRFFWALSESLSKLHCNWFCYFVFQWDCKALVPSTSKAPLQHACRGCD